MRGGQKGDEMSKKWLGRKEEKEKIDPRPLALAVRNLYL
jgi:hypothetical protein